jgi:hypothetical protein
MGALMTNEVVDWWGRYMQSDDPDHVVFQMKQEIERLQYFEKASLYVQHGYDLAKMVAEIERLKKREKELMDVIDSRDRALGFLPLDELNRHEPGGSRSAPGMGNYNYWQQMHQWGQDAEYHYYQSCQCARCRQQYDINVAEQQRILASQKSGGSL